MTPVSQVTRGVSNGVNRTQRPPRRESSLAHASGYLALVRFVPFGWIAMISGHTHWLKAAPHRLTRP